MSLLAGTFFLDTNLGLEWSLKVNCNLLAGTEGKFLSSTPTVPRASSLLHSWQLHQSSSYVCTLPSTGIHLTQPKTSFLCQTYPLEPSHASAAARLTLLAMTKSRQISQWAFERTQNISRSHQLYLLCPEALSLSHIRTNQAPCLRTPSPFCPFAEVS